MPPGIGWPEGGAVELENTLEVPVAPEQVWAFLLDVERVAPCMPGAELTEVVDDRTWKGKVGMKLGPVSLSFAGTVVLQERDEVNHRVVLKADGREMKGKGSASALVTSHLEPGGEGGTRVVMLTDLTISGAMAQYGRGMIADVSQRLTRQFADCLQAHLAAPEGAAPPPAATRPVGGIRLGLWALFRALGRALGRLGRALASTFRRKG
jgi:hypothetical protein